MDELVLFISKMNEIKFSIKGFAITILGKSCFP